ncbi:hypothetical protein SDC9_169033 [bioreactor metagenome]|uniref:Uncharacterized protein n=1 Tax=bioreactor metagenome TaxID=1076179 RepID=A0A645GCR7_9ZZZZ
MVKGSILLFNFNKFLQYSIPKILLDEVKKLLKDKQFFSLFPKYSYNAKFRANGKGVPLSKCFFKLALNSKGSLTRILDIFIISSILPLSLPKHKESTIPKLLSRLMLPQAKNSAEEILYTKGSSITKSTPLRSAILARVHLSKMEGVPL